MPTIAIRLIMACTMVLALGAASYAQEGQAFIGIQLDPTPLPELLIKHLGLKANQGIRVLNVGAASPADKVGLDRDDIIIGFQGKEVMDVDSFIGAVHQLSVRSKVTLEVIHLGQHKTAEFELGPIQENPQWKYPPEPEIEGTWGPGRIFRLGPNSENWIEIPLDNMPDVSDLPLMKRFFTGGYFFHHATDGESYTMTIGGDPKDGNTPIIVQSGEKEYRATVGKINDLPEKYRAAAKESIENAKKLSSQKVRIGSKLPLPEPPKPEVYRKYFENLTLPKVDPNLWSEQRNRMVEKLQQQVEKLQQRLEQMENRFDKTPDKSGQKNPGSGASD